MKFSYHGFVPFTDYDVSEVELYIPTYCGMTMDEIIAVSLKLRTLADSLDIDM